MMMRDLYGLAFYYLLSLDWTSTALIVERVLKRVNQDIYSFAKFHFLKLAVCCKVSIMIEAWPHPTFCKVVCDGVHFCYPGLVSSFWASYLSLMWELERETPKLHSIYILSLNIIHSVREIIYNVHFWAGAKSVTVTISVHWHCTETKQKSFRDVIYFLKNRNFS